MRSIVAVLAPAVLLVVWAAAFHPAAVGFLGIPVAGVTLLAAFVGWMLARGEARPRSAPIAWFTFLAAAGASAFYWYRVWSYLHYEMEGIPLLLFYGIGFWWPGLFVATASRYFEGGLATIARRSYLARLAIGVLGGTVGAVAYELGEAAYYEDRDRVPLSEATAHLAPAGPWFAPGSFALGHDGGTLAVGFRADPAATETTYELFRDLENTLVLARALLDRKDTSRVEVRIAAEGGERVGELLSFAAEEADSVRPTWSLAEVDRSLLPGGGRVTAEDLDAIVRWSGPELSDAERVRFDEALRYGVADGIVTIGFAPPAPPSPANAHFHAAGWRAANAIAVETAALFPDVERYAVDLPGVRADVPRESAAAAGFRLQAPLAPANRVLGLAVHRDGRGEAALDPLSFYPAGSSITARRPVGSPMVGSQVAVLRLSEPLEEHFAGALFEEILIGTGRLYVVRLAADGAAEVLYVPWRGTGHGPRTVTPGQEAWLGPELVRNLGWLPRAAFRSPVP